MARAKDIPVKAIILNKMPFDRFDIGRHEFIHATGREIVFGDGHTEIEYEDWEYGVLPEEWEEDDYAD